MEDNNKISKVRSGLNWTSEFCYKHIPKFHKQENSTPEEWGALKEKFKVQMINMDGQVICTRCELDKQNAIEEQEFNKELHKGLAARKFNTLAKTSILQDATILNASFDNYNPNLGKEEAINKQKALSFVQRYKAGEKFNLWIQSAITGVGKSHLAMSILKELNSLETECVFLDLDDTLRKIRGSFSDKESKYTEDYFIELATRVDFLVIDDLGAETGDIDTDRRASDYTSKILRAIMNGRQDKSTIITTNLSSEKLNKIYDRKVISRLMTNIEFIIFKEAVDKRVNKLAF